MNEKYRVVGFTKTKDFTAEDGKVYAYRHIFLRKDGETLVDKFKVVPSLELDGTLDEDVLPVFEINSKGVKVVDLK